MGLAASQARLLSITARMHDVELEAQNIMQKKTILATQQDALYEEYCNALDAKKLKVAFTGDSASLNYVDATFATVCGYAEGRKGNYSLTDVSTGEMIVDDEVYEKYQEFRGGDKYAFALAMFGFMPEDGFSTANKTVVDAGFIGLINDPVLDEVTTGDGLEDSLGDLDEFYGSFTDENGNQVYYLLMSDVEASVYNKHKDDLSQAMSKFQAVVNKDGGKATQADVQKAIDDFRSTLYSKYSQEIFKDMLNDTGMDESLTLDTKEFNYYVQLFEGIEAAGGCVPISKYAKNQSPDNDWFNNIIQSGTVNLNQYNTGSKKGWQTITPQTCTNFQEVSDDAAIKKAEAKYQFELKKINDKDKRYDLDLKNLETERTALDKQMDSIKKVKDENIDRTFGIFS